MSTDNILDRYGGRVRNDLNTVLNHISDDDPQDLISHPLTKYVHLDGLKAYLATYNDFIILTINIQCINAKYNELMLMLNGFLAEGLKIGAICVQETWQDEPKTNDDLNQFHINGYALLTQGRTCSRHGGLSIYLNDQYEYKLMNYDINCTKWEFQCVEIFGGNIKNKITICNIYRPPIHNNNNRVISTFLEEYSKLIRILSKVKHVCAVAGDLNLNLLKINERPLISNYFDMMVGYGFIPRITLPPRFSKRNCSLLDHIFVKDSLQRSTNESVILFSALSDHLGCATSLGCISFKQEKDKYVQVRNVNSNTITAFSEEIKSFDFSSNCNRDLSCDPNINYDIIHNTIHDAIEKHMPLKKENVKYLSLIIRCCLYFGFQYLDFVIYCKI